MKPRPLEDIIADLLNGLGITKRLQQQQVILMWGELVGTDVAERAKAVDLRGGKLFVEVGDPTWRNELIFLRREIIEKINNRVGFGIVEDIVFY